MRITFENISYLSREKQGECNMRRVQESKCAICGAWCQGFESEYGIICADCFKKKKGIWPWEIDD